MCPNDQILSAYFDSEIESPHRQSVSEHIADCMRCSGKIDSYGATRSLLRRDEIPGLEESRKRVLERIYAEKSRKSSKEIPFWQRKIVLPAPLAVAAGILFFILVGGITTIAMREEPSTIASAQREATSAMQIGGEKLEEIRELLESRDLVVEVNFKLPEKKDFVILGEPQLIPVKSEAVSR